MYPFYVTELLPLLCSHASNKIEESKLKKERERNKEKNKILRKEEEEEATIKIYVIVQSYASNTK